MNLHDGFDNYITLRDNEVGIDNCFVDIQYKDVYGNKKDYRIIKSGLTAQCARCSPL